MHALAWITLTALLKAAPREGTYGQAIWLQRTGHSVQELGDEWRAAVEKKVAASAPQ